MSNTNLMSVAGKKQASQEPGRAGGANRPQAARRLNSVWIGRCDSF